MVGMVVMWDGGDWDGDGGMVGVVGIWDGGDWDGDGGMVGVVGIWDGGDGMGMGIDIPNLKLTSLFHATANASLHHPMSLQAQSFSTFFLT